MIRTAVDLEVRKTRRLRVWALCLVMVVAVVVLAGLSLGSEATRAGFADPDARPWERLLLNHVMVAAMTSPILVAVLAGKLGPGCAVGVSAELTANSNVAEAARQANWGLAQAHDRGDVVSVYGDSDEDVDLLPRTVEESRRIARKILGPLLDYDRQHDGDLLVSVRTFLANDGSWQKAADQLGIHRQTLVYRLRRVEELTALKPTSTEGAAQLWLALSGVERANLSLDDLRG